MYQLLSCRLNSTVPEACSTFDESPLTDLPSQTKPETGSLTAAAAIAKIHTVEVVRLQRAKGLVRFSYDRITGTNLQLQQRSRGYIRST